MFSLAHKIVAFIAFLGISCILAINSENVGQLPHCVDSDQDVGYVLVSTLDGKLTSVNSYGIVLWEVETGPGPLLASNIHNVELTNNGEWVRIIPSLTGSLYKFNGKTIDAIPISADSLLKSSFMYSNDLVIAGGRDVRTYGVSARSGDVIYECSLEGCTNKTSVKDDFEDVLIIERSTSTVRAHEPRTGAERWNFSVGYHNIRIPQTGCINLDPVMHNLNFTAILPKGLLIASNGITREVTWQCKFDSPIVKVWRWDGHDLVSIDLFSQAKPAQAVTPLSPAIYLGMHNKQETSCCNFFRGRHLDKKAIWCYDSYKQINNIEFKLYIHESLRMINAVQVEIDTSTGVIESKSLTRIPWKPISATELEENHDDSTALSVLYSSEYINGNGYYFYTESDILCGGNSTRKKFQRFIMGEIMYWKELMLVVITAIIVNMFWNYGSLRVDRFLRRHHSLQPSEPDSQITKSTSLSDSKSEQSLTDLSDTTFTSRYVKDFDTVRCLGRGGYGVVFEVKQKIDEYGYAIKRITLSDKSDTRQRVLREVRTLAKLDHPNIVRYCTSWVECPPPGWRYEYDQKWVGDLSSVATETSETSNMQCQKPSPSTIISISSDDNVTFERNSQSSDHIYFLDSSKEEIETKESTIETDISTNSKSSKRTDEVAYLYIQMQLCKKESLKDWLTINRTRQRNMILNIFNQILSAVEYVHSQKLIHRDLKPSNIFFSQEDLIKVGDFGLVTTMKNIDCESTVYEDTVRSHTKGAGTYLYMSPEQIERKKYDYKVDIFSLGVILFELLVPFDTEMERNKTLNNLRHETYPEDFSINYPREHNLLKRMLSQKPSDRPNAVDVKTIINTIGDSDFDDPTVYTSLPADICLNC